MKIYGKLTPCVTLVYSKKCKEKKAKTRDYPWMKTQGNIVRKWSLW